MQYGRSLVFFAIVLTGVIALSVSGYISGPNMFRKAPAFHPQPVAQVVERYYTVLAFWEKELGRDRINYMAAQNMARMHMAIARATSDESHYRTAEDILRKALDITPKNDFSTEALLARAIMSRHAFIDARQIADKLVALSPKNKRYLQLHADAAFGMGDYEAAFPDIEKLLKIAPGYSSFTRAAQMMELKGKLDGALDFYQRSIKDYDGDDAEPISWILSQMGQNRLKAGDTKGAEKYLKEALDRTPEYSLAVTPLARVYLAEGNDADARELLLQAVKLNPEPAVFSVLADIETRSGKNTEAQEFREEALRRATARANDGTGGHLRELAELLYDRKEDAARAVELVEQDLKLRPGEIKSNEVAARVYEFAGQPDKAAEHDRLAKRLLTN